MMLDLESFKRTPLSSEPYDHIVIPNFVKSPLLKEACDDFPAIGKPGSFPLDSLKPGKGFQNLIDAFGQPEVAEAFSEKFGVDVTDKPLMATVRGFMQQSDGRIHTDSESKIITALIYMNEEWPADGGRLRILRNGHNIDDMSAEVPPLAGTLLAFRRSDHSWHGHKPFVGPRRSIQFNYMRDGADAAHHLGRHSLSAMIKSLRGWM